MTPRDLILRKRNGGALAPAEVAWLVREYTAGRIPEYQMAAFLMAVYFTGMDESESGALTDAMLRSGEILDLSSVPGKKVDKHSTGGVGDKVSLIAAPMAAACGVPVPMISGRGLGHTGGTLDKLEAIPGFRTRLTPEEFRTVLARTGLVFAGQTDTLAPADRRLYALRDVTGTVESLPLIAGSIMSKKLAEGIDALVLDVKFGTGAFMKTETDARRLAEALVGIGRSAGKDTIAFLTAMNEPLGFAVGNWVEVAEAVACLRGRSVRDLMEVSLVIGGAMVYLGGKAAGIGEGMKLCLESLWSGRAYETFLRTAELQGGDTSVLGRPEQFPPAKHTADVRADRPGIIASVDAFRIGGLVMELGAGRRTLDDSTDPNAGAVLRKKAGDTVDTGEVLAMLHSDRREISGSTIAAAAGCFTVGDSTVPHAPGVLAVVDGEGYREWTPPQIS